MEGFSLALRQSMGIEGKKGEDKRPPTSGTFILTLELVPGHTFPLSAAVPSCKGKRRALRPPSVDPIEAPAGSLGGEEISIIIHGSGSSRRRRALGPIPELEVAKNFFDDRRVFDATDDA
jgi:hypothetical protein